jgi:hypothetical protein
MKRSEERIQKQLVSAIDKILTENPHMKQRPLFVYTMQHLARRTGPDECRQFLIELLWPAQPVCVEDLDVEDSSGAGLLDQAIERLTQGSFDFQKG